MRLHAVCGLDGDNLLRLIIVQQFELPRLQTGDRRAGLIEDHHIESQASFWGGGIG